ncbi:MAG: J domain-containing protein [Hyphomonadaceae bacterium]
MASAFHYRPKFVDIRVKKPDPARASVETEPRACDHIGCTRPGEHRAPKSREQANQYWWFCQQHASDYNRRWNYFEGMSDAEYEAFSKDAEGGHRPTWSFRADKTDRLSAAMRRFRDGKAAADHFGLFGKDNVVRERPAARRRELTRLQVLALEVLMLEEDAEPAAVRARYAEMVKRYHPDSNGGDRSSEAQLIRVIRAYQTLKSAGLA